MDTGRPRLSRSLFKTCARLCCCCETHNAHALRAPKHEGRYRNGRRRQAWPTQPAITQAVNRRIPSPAIPSKRETEGGGLNDCRLLSVRDCV